jgi:hypothetical protein
MQKARSQKTRAAPLAGLSFQANDQGRFGEIYHDWLQGGAEMPRQVELDALLQAIKQVPEAKKVALKTGLREQFGPMTSLTVEQMPAVWNAVRATLGVEVHPFVDAGDDGPPICTHCGCLVLAGWHDDNAPLPAQTAPQAPAEPDPGADTPEDPPESAQEPHGGASGDAEPDPDGARTPDDPPADVAVQTDEGEVNLADYEAQLVAWADELRGQALQDELEREGLSLSGSVGDRRTRLVGHLEAKAATAAGANPGLAPGAVPF